MAHVKQCLTTLWSSRDHHRRVGAAYEGHVITVKLEWSQATCITGLLLFQPLP